MEKKIKLMFLMLSLSLVSLGSQAESDSDLSDMILCLPMEMSISTAEASQYANTVMKMVENAVSSTQGSSYELTSKGDVKIEFSQELKTTSELEFNDMMLIRNGVYTLLTRKKLQLEYDGISSVKVSQATEASSFPGAQYLVTFGLKAHEEGSDKGTLYEMTVGIYYTHDTCSGEGYTPGPEGIFAVKNEEGRLLAIFSEKQ